MACCLSYKNNFYTSKNLVQELEAARNKLTPIIGQILSRSEDIVQSRDNSPIEWILTTDQYEYIKSASQLLKAVENKHQLNTRTYKLPNSNVIVNNVTVSNETQDKNRNIVVNEATVLKLFKLYEEMGVVINKIISGNARITSSYNSSEHSLLDSHQNERATSSENPDQLTPQEFTEKNENFEKNSPYLPTSDQSIEIQSQTDEENLGNENSDHKPVSEKNSSTFEIKLKNSVLQSSSQHESEKSGESTVISKTQEQEPTIFIKIQCFSDGSNDEFEEKAHDKRIVNCSNASPSHYHLQIGGDPVTVKIEQNSADEGNFYCINVDNNEDGNQVKVVIKQCPECLSTVIASSSKINDMVGKSHESVTLHGEGGNEDLMAFSSDFDDIRRNQSEKSIPKENHYKEDNAESITRSSTEASTDLEQKNVDETDTTHEQLVHETNTNTDHSDKDKSVESEMTLQSNTISDKQSDSTSNKTMENKLENTSNSKAVIDVILDPENLELSTVKEKEEIKQPSSLLTLTRRRICSSMEFDVTTVNTRMRDNEIEHGNPHILLELRKLGVDQILRACRPAKCCRKAILNERQRTALPYSVSLRSLPLMGNDIEVIKQSIDMSVKKIKNSLDISQSHKEKLAFYVSLGRDNLKPDTSCPWVVPLYEVNTIQEKTNTNPEQNIFKNDIIYSETNILYDSTINIINKNEQKYKTTNKKKYILVKPKYVLQPIQYTKLKKQKSKTSFTKTYACKRVQSIVNVNRLHKNILSMKKAISPTNTNYQRRLCRTKQNYQEKTRFDSEKKMFSQRTKCLSELNVSFDQSSPPAKTIFASKYLEKFKNHGDCRNSSFHRLFELYIHNLRKNLNENTTDKCQASDTYVSPCWRHTSEELYYKSSALTIFFKGNKRMELIKQQSIFDTYKHLLHKTKPKKQKCLKNKLEYYVGLLDGNLVWRKSRSLTPLNYSTYYNFSEEGGNSESNSTRKITSNVVNKDVGNIRSESKRTIDKSDYTSESRRNTASQLMFPQQTPTLHIMPVTSTVLHSNKLRSSVVRNMDNRWNNAKPVGTQKSTYLDEDPTQINMGPEKQNLSWSPFLASISSLPAISGESVQDTKSPQLEAAVPNPKLTTTLESTPRRPVRTPLETKNSPQIKKPEKQTIKRKCRNRDIILEATSAASCNLEICEIYKNRKFACKKLEVKGKRKITIPTDKDVEIYIL